MQVQCRATVGPLYETPNGEKDEKGPDRQPNPQINLESHLLGLVWGGGSKQPVNVKLRYL
jgi:hypothetical protein